MQTAKTDQTGRMPRVIRVFAGHTGHFVGFVVQWSDYSIDSFQGNRCEQLFRGSFLLEVISSLPIIITVSTVWATDVSSYSVVVFY